MLRYLKNLQTFKYLSLSTQVRFAKYLKLIDHNPMRSIIFIIVLFCLLAYTVFKFNQILPEKKILATVSASFVFLVMILWQIVYRNNTSLVYDPTYKMLSFAGAAIMGVWASFVILSLISDFIHMLVYFSDKVASTKVIDGDRRQLLTRWIPMGLFGASAGMAMIGTARGLEGPEVKYVEVEIENLHPELENFSMAQISDLHVGPNIGKEYVENVVGLTNRLKPDLIAVTGDMVDGFPEALAEAIAPLANLEAVHGVFYVTGNHEYYWNGPAWIEQARKLNFTPLINENRILTVNSAKFLIGGVPDKQAPRFYQDHEPNYVLAGQHSDSVDFKLLLAHRPDVYQQAHEQNFNLVLAGHTHAGQFFPWSLIVSLAYKFYKGLNRFQNLWVYVNAGTGYWGPMNRFSIPSEITYIKLKSKKHSS